ncbi:hypothetical protein ACH9L7_15280 [Haloferax sp. S1W]|uniref:DUF7573 domain-containing protein n=1 Tax=Haloferax sp. S1W TaxID=3377110 RepID=UPI0037C8612A
MPNRSLDDFGSPADNDDPAESVSDDTAESVSDDTAESVSDDTAESVSDDTAESVSDDTAESVSDDTATEEDSDAPDTLATYRWTPDGTPCPACGETVQKRWLDGEQYVCHDCKDW